MATLDCSLEARFAECIELQIYHFASRFNDP
jgi:hypothetical protein